MALSYDEKKSLESQKQNHRTRTENRRYQHQVDLMDRRADLMDKRADAQMDLINKREEIYQQHKEEQEKLKKRNMGINMVGESFGTLANSPMGVSSSGSMNQNIGLLNKVVEPAIIIRTKQKMFQPEDDSDYGDTIGLPSYKVTYLRSCVGWTVCSQVHANIPNATDTECEMIEVLLMKGVVIE